jgi:hypothetical protein
MFRENDVQVIKVQRAVQRAHSLTLSKRNRHKGRTEFGRQLYNPKRLLGNSSSFTPDCPCHPCPTNKISLRKKKLQCFIEYEMIWANFVRNGGGEGALELDLNLEVDGDGRSVTSSHDYVHDYLGVTRKVT